MVVGVVKGDMEVDMVERVAARQVSLIDPTMLVEILIYAPTNSTIQSIWKALI